MNSPTSAGTFSALAAAARQHRASTRQVTLLTVRFIAEPGPSSLTPPPSA